MNSSEPPGPHSTDCFEQIPKIKRPNEWATTKCYIVHFCNKKHWKLMNKIKVKWFSIDCNIIDAKLKKDITNYQKDMDDTLVAREFLFSKISLNHIPMYRMNLLTSEMNKVSHSKML